MASFGTPTEAATFFADASDGGTKCEMYEAIHQLELWPWLRDFKVDPKKGFMFTRNPNLAKIEAMCTAGHSGASFGFFMRHMECIAKNGWAAYKQACAEPAAN